jgi:hypothetical protein
MQQIEDGQLERVGKHDGGTFGHLWREYVWNMDVETLPDVQTLLHPARGDTFT